MKISNDNEHRQRMTPIVACVIALSMAGCGQMGDLYQPLPEPKETEQATAAPSSGKDEAAAERGD